MKIGFDVDGVLADFSSSYQDVLRKVSGRDLFLPGDAEDAPCWDWDKYRGYTPEERAAAWTYIRNTPEFNLNLSPLEGVSTLRLLVHDMNHKHTIYFITSRVGERVKRWTEIWLEAHLGFPSTPTVLIATQRSKGLFAKGLALDVYVDDNYDNVHDVVEASTARTYLRTRRYNQQRLVDVSETGCCPPCYVLEDYPSVDPQVIRVDTLGQMFDHEINNL